MVEKKVEKGFILISVLLILVILFSLNNFSVLKTPSSSNEDSMQTATCKQDLFYSADGGTVVRMYLPAVDADGNGVNTLLSVEASRGSGKTHTSHAIK